MMKFSQLLMVSTAATMFWSVAAVAQTDGANTADNDDSGAIVVTAQKYEQKLQDVPIPVTAFTSKMRDELGLTTQQQVAAFTPGMSYSNDPSRVYLRGIGRTTTAKNSDPGVGIYYDGVYSTSAAAIATPNIITERMEVLRGPQGTLYGKNTTGGAINIISKRPTKEFTGEFRENLGNYQRSESGLTLSGPLTDSIRYRLTGTYKWQGDGFMKNVAGPDIGVGKNYSLEAQIEADVTSNLKVWVKYGYARLDQVGGASSYTRPYTTGPITLDTITVNPLFGYTVPNPGITDRRAVAYNTEQKLTGTSHQVIGHVDWDVGDHTTLRYVGGFAHGKASVTADLDKSARTDPFDVGGVLISPVNVGIIPAKTGQYSNELNLISSGNEKLDYVLGAYQYHDFQSFVADLRRPLQYALTPDLLPNNPTGTYLRSTGKQANNTYAGFGQADYHLDDQFTVQAGLRYTYDKKRVADHLTHISFMLPGFFFDLPDGLPPSSMAKSYEGWSGKIALQWQPDPDTNVFALVSRGYKSGAITDTGKQLDVPPEKLTDYEVGFKKNFGRALSLDLAAFYYDYRNMQLETIGDDPTLPGNYKTVYASAPKARSYGFEAEANWKITNHLDALLSYSYLNAKIVKMSGQIDLANRDAGPQDLSGNRMPQSPKNKVAANIGYTFDFAPGSLRLSGNYIYTSTKYFDIFTTPTYRGKPFHQVDLRALFTDKDNRFTVIGYVANLLNKDAINYVSLVNGTPDTASSLNDPRTFGVELQVRF